MGVYPSDPLQSNPVGRKSHLMKAQKRRFKTLKKGKKSTKTRALREGNIP
jgi:hypothetical protein